MSKILNLSNGHIKYFFVILTPRKYAEKMLELYIKFSFLRSNQIRHLIKINVIITNVIIFVLFTGKYNCLFSDR